MSKAEERNKERAQAALDYANNLEDVKPIDVFSRNLCIALGQAFMKGAEWADNHQAEKDLLDNIWHSPDEEPEIDRKIIWESENFLGKHLDKEWKPMIDCFGRKERWCYLADILPSENWTGERPYSKVDYSRGYEKGYEQAEKDLELTWEDIPKILHICEQLKTRWWFIGDDEQTKLIGTQVFWEEVLKQFKEMKEHGAK